MVTSKRTFRRVVPVLAIIAVLLLSVISVSAAEPTLESRTGFSDTLLLYKGQPGLTSKWGFPTDLEWTPDNRLLLITQQTGQLYVYTGSPNMALALDLSSRICTNRERGLVGMAVDPQFASNGYIYLYYTRKIDPACPFTTLDEAPKPGLPLNRVSRFVFNLANNTVDPASETVLVDNMESYAGIHNAGYLHIAADGYLYISVGDAGRRYPSQRDDALRGKILRVNRTTGDGAPDNPHGSNPQAVRCGDPTQNRDEQGAPCREVFAKGLRNPFRLAFKPNSNEFWINDVGANTWEDISVGAKGANYGWASREGPCAYAASCLPGSTSPPGTPPNEPIFFYRHTDASGTDPDSQFNGCSSITGAVFVPPAAWPAEYDGDYIFGDYACGRIFQLQPTASGRYQASTLVDGLGESSVVTMTFGPGPNGQQSLYYSTFRSGQLHRIDYTGSANRLPTARLAADKTYGVTPLRVNFDASASSDPDGDGLTYVWNFGVAGATRETTSPNTSFTYQTDGIYTASLTVRDSRGAVSSATSVTIGAGDEPPAPRITSPQSPPPLFRVGETLTLRGEATDNNAGPVSLSWQVLQHHDQHTHPYAQGSEATLVITAPAPEDLQAAQTSYLRVLLTATDAAGLTSDPVQLVIRPQMVGVTLASQPQGAVVEVNDVPVTLPKLLPSWEGYQLGVQAELQTIGGRWMTPTRWTDNAPPDRTITTPPRPTTYTLLLEPGQPPTPTPVPSAPGQGQKFRVSIPFVDR